MSGIPSPLSMPKADRFKDNNISRFKFLLLAGAKAHGSVTYIAATVWYSRAPFEEEWGMRDAYTQAMIITNINNPVGCGITDTMTAAEAHPALTGVYSLKTDLGLVTAEHEWHNILYVDGANFDEFIADL
ncbi:hypothetical protein DFH09DRAFT_1352806 [Mycena vulgaris]|nr:hypothetical protein DFH09DRAFT_1352806 [Mycena vulgaris]